MKHWKRNIKLRLVMLEAAGVGFSEYPNICDALEVTPQGWRHLKDTNNPSSQTIKRVSRALAMDAWTLMSPDAGIVVNAPVPSWKWLKYIGRTDGDWADLMAMHDAGSLA